MNYKSLRFLIDTRCVCVTEEEKDGGRKSGETKRERGGREREKIQVGREEREREGKN